MPICQLKINETALTSIPASWMLRLEGGERNFMVQKVFSHIFFSSFQFFFPLYTNTQVEKYFVVVDVVVQTCAVWGVLIGRQSLLHGLPSGVVFFYYFVPISVVFFFVLFYAGRSSNNLSFN